MSPKRHDDVAPPAIDGEWRIRYATTDTVNATTDTVNGWGDLDEAKRTVWIDFAGVGHPKGTD